MRGGRLDIRITVQTATASTTDTGAKQKNWATYAVLWAERDESQRLGASEGTIADQLTPIHKIIFKVRYSTTADAITSKMRVLYAGKYYDILSVQETVHRQWLMINCELRNDGAGSTTPSACEAATYRNSDSSYTQEIASGATGVGPDITVTDADTTTRDVPANTDVTCAFPSLTVANTVPTVLSTVTSYPAGGVITAPNAIIQNSDKTLNIQAPSGAITTLSDATITEVDGSTSDSPAGSDVTCAWSTVTVNNSGGDPLLSIASYPAGGNAVLANQQVNVNNSEGTTIDATVTYLNDGGIVVDDTEIEDSAGSTFDVATCRVIKIPSTTVSNVAVVGDTMTITTPSASTPSGICYNDTAPIFNTSYVTGDSWDKFLAGAYENTPPSHAASKAQLDYSATQADVRATAATGTSLTDSVAPTMLKENNSFGNKFVWTDDAGNPSSQNLTPGSNLWAHMDFNNHDWSGATTGVLVNHLNNFEYTQSYLLDGALFNLTTANGQSWSNWIAYINGLGTYLSRTGWMPLDGSDFSGAHGAKCQPSMVWADNMFNLERSDNRGSFLLGESASATSYYSIYDSGNDDMMVDVSKSTSSGFQDVIVNIFIKRKRT